MLRMATTQRSSRLLLGAHHLPRRPPELSHHCRLLSTQCIKEKSLPGLLLRPVLFTGAICAGSFGFANIYQQDGRKQIASPGDISFPWRVPPQFGQILPDKVTTWIENTLHDERTMTVGPILAANVAVYVAFKLARSSVASLPTVLIRRLLQRGKQVSQQHNVSNFLTTHFVHHPDSGRALPLLLSCFAHTGILHLASNMCCLWASADALINTLGGSREKFWAAYVSAGTLSSLGGMCVDLAMARVRGGLSIAGSLGASGAVIGVLVAFCLANPDGRMSLIFLPRTVFSAEHFVQGLVAFDLIGLALGWRVIAHGAHLGGAAAGFLLVQMGVASKPTTSERPVYTDCESPLPPYHEATRAPVCETKKRL